MNEPKVFLFPGQGSYDAGLLHELYTGHPAAQPGFLLADAAARRLLGEPFLPLDGGSPDLQQLGIFLAGVEVARALERRGVRPDLLAGHSFGELAALCAGEVFDLASGVEIVCHRVLALRSVPTEGAMAALSCGPERAQELLRELGRPSLEIAVLNHPRQTVVSGPRPDLEALASLAAERTVSLTFLKSRYPFHSSHLAPAVERFAASLRAYRFGPARVPVYLGMERRLHAPELDMPALLASQLTRRLDFAAVARDLHARGYRRFVEAGSGDMVSKVVAKNLAITTEQSSQWLSKPETAAPEPCPQMPIAIVAMGCVLPSAADPDELWRHVLEGVSGIVDLTELDPDLGRDFVAGSQAEVVPGKTYTLLSGAIRQVAFDRQRLAGFFDEKDFSALTRGQQLLACALG
ncbi:MAG TPA: acyltransferase domain-containing protein, partial [Thermoanaerobaculia bacterium]|nr:acyltransferase domain-containing protein [Thermoanaerobaculia bacterium]